MPLYIRIQDALIEQLKSGALKPGDRMPTEDVLMREHAVSRITVRKALELLQHQGLIERYAGKGTFVRKRSPGSGWVASSINDVLQLGAETVPKGLDWRLVNDAPAARQLGLPVHENLFRLRAVRAHEGVPVYVVEGYVPESIGRRLHRDDFKGSMLISLLEEKLRIPVSRGQEEISAGIADRRLARLLKVKPGTPVLILDLVYFAVGDQPVEYARAWYRADMFRRRNVLSRGGHPAWRPVVVAPEAAITVPQAKRLKVSGGNA